MCVRGVCTDRNVRNDKENNALFRMPRKVLPDMGSKMQGVDPAGRGSFKLANAFPDGWGKIPNNPLVAAAIASLFKGGSGARSLMGGYKILNIFDNCYDDTVYRQRNSS